MSGRTRCRNGHDLTDVGTYQDGSCKECARKRARRYYKANRETIREQQKKYHDMHREAALERQKRYREANREVLLEQRKKLHAARDSEQNKRWRAANPEKLRENDKRRYATLRREALYAYGVGTCAICGAGPLDIAEYQLDHVNGGGRLHRQQTGHGRGFLSALRARGWPNDPPLQTLCIPCHVCKTAEERQEREQ